ncbi:AlpA family phage regulatory protein [Gymnodinialimonas ceratoperidinii]|uniref:AlpA family phage regulatory protein n=2 Tax=Gymnodinialimonas ceratoperidinii TaxID=2856823 RepID=A0A8F6YCK6_9RHOB|nr:AlpA family phage regulatory protein [Gymnodinialimonas ceratoperidinii]QXT39430.1 AlpA family phage regulatory protein [Gymnodinialimonas ceratoperidinii]
MYDISNKGPLIVGRDGLTELGIRVSNSTLLRWEFDGRFPRRIRMAGCSVAWPADEILAWVEDRKTERSRTHYARPD